MRRLVCTAALPALVCLACVRVSAVQQANGPDGCHSYTWSPPRALLTGDGDLVHVMRPDVALLHEAVVLVGTEVLRSSSSGLKSLNAPDWRSRLAGAVWQPGLVAGSSMPGQTNESMLHAAWINGEWVIDSRLFGVGMSGGAPWIVALSNGELLAGWSALANWNGMPFEPYDDMWERPPDPWPVTATVISRGRPACSLGE